MKIGAKLLVQQADREDRALAKAKVADRRRELETGLYRGITPITWRDFLQEHLPQLAHTVSEATYREHDRALRQIEAACHPRNLTVIDFQMLEKFRSARIAEGSAPATVNKALRTFQGILEEAVKRGYLSVNPFKGNRWPAVIFHEL